LRFRLEAENRSEDVRQDKESEMIEKTTENGVAALRILAQALAAYQLAASHNHQHQVGRVIFENP
jgi:hypothetical protein